MKNATLTLFAILSGFLVLINASSAYAQVSKQERDTGPFNGIYQSTSADVYITKGNSHSVIVKADSDKIDNIVTQVDDGILVIKTEKNFRYTRTLEVYITMPSLDYLKNSGSGDFTIEGSLEGKNVQIIINGSGDTEASLDATNLELVISGSGDVNLSGVRGEMSIKISGSGDVYADNLQLNDCKAVVYGSGDIKLKGKAATLVTKQSGSGDFNGYGLTAVSATLSSNGSGDAVVNVVEKLKATLNGSGDLTYFGTPEYVDAVSNGSGEVYRK